MVPWVELLVGHEGSYHPAKIITAQRLWDEQEAGMLPFVGNEVRRKVIEVGVVSRHEATTVTTGLPKLALVGPAIPSGLERRNCVQTDVARATGYLVRKIFVKEKSHRARGVA
jgi:hypothetical protein